MWVAALYFSSISDSHIDYVFRITKLSTISLSESGHIIHYNGLQKTKVHFYLTAHDLPIEQLAVSLSRHQAAAHFGLFIRQQTYFTYTLTSHS